MFCVNMTEKEGDIFYIDLLTYYENCKKIIFLAECSFNKIPNPQQEQEVS